MAHWDYYQLIIMTGIPCSARLGGKEHIQWTEVDPWILVLEVTLAPWIYGAIIVQNSWLLLCLCGNRLWNKTKVAFTTYSDMLFFVKKNATKIWCKVRKCLVLRLLFWIKNKTECFTSTKSTIRTMFATEVTQQYYIYFEDSGYVFTLTFI